MLTQKYKGQFCDLTPWDHELTQTSTRFMFQKCEIETAFILPGLDNVFLTIFAILQRYAPWILLLPLLSPEIQITNYISQPF